MLRYTNTTTGIRWIKRSSLRQIITVNWANNPSRDTLERINRIEGGEVIPITLCPDRYTPQNTAANKSTLEAYNRLRFSYFPVLDPEEPIDTSDL